jgi:hypothetical protein
MTTDSDLSSGVRNMSIISTAAPAVYTLTKGSVLCHYQTPSQRPVPSYGDFILWPTVQSCLSNAMASTLGVQAREHVTFMAKGGKLPRQCSG